MDFSVVLTVLLLSLFNLSFVWTGWRGPSNRWTQGSSISSSNSHSVKRVRLKPPLHRPRPKTGIQRRTSGSNKDMVHFYLYPDTKDTTYKEEIVVGNNVSLSSYNPDHYPIILIHGYMHNYSRIYPQRTKDAYLRKGFKANIIIMDWQSLSHQRGYGIINNIAMGYPKASKQMTKMSRQLSDFIMYLVTERVLKDPTSVHLVGIGFGAQIAGLTGHYLKRSTGMQIKRITGLDPSGLQYHYTAMSEKLDKSDAAFVDVIHTTSFGISSSIGHVDFYPNGGGPTQPGCKALSLLDMVKDIPGMEGSCAHQRAAEYFTDSIFNKNIFACQSSSFLVYKMKSFCVKPVVFGQHVSTKATGDYFLELLRKDSRS